MHIKIALLKKEKDELVAQLQNSIDGIAMIVIQVHKRWLYLSYFLAHSFLSFKCLIIVFLNILLLFLPILHRRGRYRGSYSKIAPEESMK